MQPCPNCGRTELSPAGNCLNCGLFRGNEGYGQGGYAPGPYQQPGYQYQQPYAEQTYPTQPQYGAGYQAPQPVAPARRPSTVPLIVLSVIAVILVIGIVGVVIVKAAGDDDQGGGGTGGTGTTASGIDKCVVGSWRITSAKEKVDQDGTLIEFTARGGNVDLKSDGTGKTDYGNGVVYTGTVSGQSVSITFTGSVTFSFKTVDGSFTFSNIQPNGTATVKVNGTTTTSIPLDMDTKPVKYECNGNTMTQSTDLATTEMSK